MQRIGKQAADTLGDVDFFGTTAHHQFSEQFAGLEKLKEGSELIFCWDARSSKLTTVVDGQQLGQVQSSLLCESLFREFLGPQSLVPLARWNITTGLRQPLSSLHSATLAS